MVVVAFDPVAEFAASVVAGAALRALATAFDLVAESEVVPVAFVLASAFAFAEM